MKISDISGKYGLGLNHGYQIATRRTVSLFKGERSAIKKRRFEIAVIGVNLKTSNAALVGSADEVNCSNYSRSTTTSLRMANSDKIPILGGKAKIGPKISIQRDAVFVLLNQVGNSPLRHLFVTHFRI